MTDLPFCERDANLMNTGVDGRGDNAARGPEEPGVITILWKDSILDTVRQRPGMYLGSKSLTGLNFFLRGVEMARSAYGIQAEPEVPSRFADWVGYRLHLGSNCSGFWHQAILHRIRDEKLAFDRFYELRDEFLQRKGRVVGTVRKECREYKVHLLRSREPEEIVECTETLPESLRLVVYTEDPGFFLECDDSEPFFYNGWFVDALDSSDVPLLGRLDIHDHAVWERLLAENKRYKKNLARTRARIRKKERDRGPADRASS